MTVQRTSPADLANLPACLDGHDPRLLAEVVSTIALAEEQAPRAGQHTITFASMQAINPRWAGFPDAGRACIEYMNVGAVNRALGYMGGFLAVYERYANGDILVGDPMAPTPKSRRSVQSTARTA